MGELRVFTLTYLKIKVVALISYMFVNLVGFGRTAEISVVLARCAWSWIGPNSCYSLDEVLPVPAVVKYIG